MIMKKLLFILPVLLLSSTVQINAMQDDNIHINSQGDNKRTQTLKEIHNIINKFKLDKTKKEEILNNISKVNDEYVALYWMYEALNKLPSEEFNKLQSDEIITEILENITKTRDEEYVLNYERSHLFDELQELLPNEITTEIFLNISRMDHETLDLLYLNLLEEIQPKEITIEILSNICKMDAWEMSGLHYILCALRELSKFEIKKYILSNLSSMNKYKLGWMDYIFCQLYLKEINLKEISEETLLNIIKIEIKTFKDIDSVISELQKCIGENDLLSSISKNIRKMNKDTLLNIDKMNGRQLYHLYYLLDKSSLSDKITGKILYNISKMNENEIYRLDDILKLLPDEITTEILENISKMNEGELSQLYNILKKLPSEEITTEILSNISKINNKDTLNKLYNDLEDAKDDNSKMQVLRYSRVIPEK